MIKIAIKSVFENSEKISSAWKQVDKKKCIYFGCINATVYILIKLLKKHEEQINYLQTEIDGIKSTLV